MNKIHKNILKNGLTVLSYPLKTIPKVAIQLWYGVGSKNERDGQRGLAHLLEHMIFKGTKKLSETDINEITHKLAGMSNAFTGHDYTGYLFNFPTQNWRIALPILADCMQNCTFKQDLLNAELKAVIQEMKMYHDDYQSTISEKLISQLFNEHPYHYPIIGYKQDLWSVNRDNLYAFYKKHYIPNDATLVVVGDIDPKEVLSLAQQSFESIPADLNYKKDFFTHSKDILNKSVTIYRDIQQPLITLAFLIPGASTHQDYLIDVCGYIFAQGKGSRLYKKLIDELHLASDLQVEKYDLFDEGLLLVHIYPIEQENISQILAVVANELATLQNISKIELERAVKMAHMEHADIFEDFQKIAYMIGRLYISTGDENALMDYGKNQKDLKERVISFFKSYLHHAGMHMGFALPLLKEDKNVWIRIQEKSDKLDQSILNCKVRNSSLEKAQFANSVHANPVPECNFAKPQRILLDNGLKVLWHTSKLSEKIDLIIRFKSQYYDCPPDKQGLYNFLCDVMQEGTQHYSAEEFALALESSGMILTFLPGMLSLSMLKQDLEKGLELITELLMNPSFKDESIEKIRKKIISEIASYWDTPDEFVFQIAKEKIYKDHPYSQNILGTDESIKKITKSDLIDFYKNYISAQEAQLAIVGDLNSEVLQKALQNSIAKWQGNKVPDTFFPIIKMPKAQEFTHFINRDQTIFTITGLSCKRIDPHYDAMLLLDQLVTGGILGSSNSYLFQIREQSGLFYNTSGSSLVLGVDEQPGLIFIKTLISNDRLEEGKKIILETLINAPDRIDQEELDQAKNVIINSFIDHFSNNYEMAETFLFLDRFDLPFDYFDKRIKEISKISLDQVKKITREIIDKNNLITVKVGRTQ